MSETILECSALCKSYGKKEALRDVSLKLEAGTITGLLGPNGSGKTTLIKILNSLLQPNGGEIRVCGEKIGIKTKEIISYLPDCLSLPSWMNVPELMDFYSGFYKDFNMPKALEMTKNLGVDEKKPIKALSKGTKEKVQLILAMSREAKLYLLDEPLGGVDPATRDYILETIISGYSRDAAVMISTHLISDVENILDKVYFLKNGEIVMEDSVDNIRDIKGKSVDKLFREVFKCAESF